MDDCVNKEAEPMERIIETDYILSLFLFRDIDKANSSSTTSKRPRTIWGINDTRFI